MTKIITMLCSGMACGNELKVEMTVRNYKVTFDMLGENRGLSTLPAEQRLGCNTKESWCVTTITGY